MRVLVRAIGILSLVSLWFCVPPSAYAQCPTGFVEAKEVVMDGEEHPYGVSELVSGLGEVSGLGDSAGPTPIVFGYFLENEYARPLVWDPDHGSHDGLAWECAPGGRVGLLDKPDGTDPCEQAWAVGVSADGDIAVKVERNSGAELLFRFKTRMKEDPPDEEDPWEYYDQAEFSIVTPNSGLNLGATSTYLHPEEGPVVNVIGAVGPTNPNEPGEVPDYELCGGADDHATLQRLTSYMMSEAGVGIETLVQDSTLVSSLPSPYRDPWDGIPRPLFGMTIWEVLETMTCDGVAPTHEMNPFGVSDQRHIVGQIRSSATVHIDLEDVFSDFFPGLTYDDFPRRSFLVTPTGSESYSVIILDEVGALPPESFCPGAVAVNRHGDVAGCFQSDNLNQAFYLPNDGSIITLSSLGGGLSRARALNNSKCVVGTYQIESREGLVSTSSDGFQGGFDIEDYGDSSYRAFIYPAGPFDDSMLDINEAPIGITSWKVDQGAGYVPSPYDYNYLTEAKAINSFGYVLGKGFTSDVANPPSSNANYFLLTPQSGSSGCNPSALCGSPLACDPCVCRPEQDPYQDQCLCNPEGLCNETGSCRFPNCIWSEGMLCDQPGAGGRPYCLCNSGEDPVLNQCECNPDLPCNQDGACDYPNCQWSPSLQCGVPGAGKYPDCTCSSGLICGEVGACPPAVGCVPNPSYKCGEAGAGARPNCFCNLGEDPGLDNCQCNPELECGELGACERPSCRCSYGEDPDYDQCLCNPKLPCYQGGCPKPDCYCRRGSNDECKLSPYVECGYVGAAVQRPGALEDLCYCLADSTEACTPNPDLTCDPNNPNVPPAPYCRCSEPAPPIDQTGGYPPEPAACICNPDSYSCGYRVCKARGAPRATSSTDHFIPHPPSQ